MDKICDICGDEGVEEAMITCCKCKINCEHMYCMRTPIEDPDDYWECGVCEPNTEISPLTSPVTSMSKSSNAVDVLDGDVKCEESKSFSNQLGKKGSFNWEKKVTKGKTKYISAEEAIKLSSGSFKSLATPKRGITPRPREKFKDQRAGNLEISKGEMCKKLPTGGNDHNTMELRTSNIKNVNKNLSPELGTLAHIPALRTSWRGNFCIHDHKKGEMKFHVHAHTAPLVHRKVYECLKQFPEVLHFEVVPRKKFWMDFFQEQIPDSQDIGLYFFSSEAERSDNFISFVESMNVENYALRKQIDEMELLVFTSESLSEDCQGQKGKSFLWGVLHVKREPSPCQDDGLPASSREPLDDLNSRCNQGDNSEEVDMDIDMLGGVEVGKIDVVVYKESLKEQAVVSYEPTSIN